MNVESPASRLGIEQCNEPLSRGRVCVRTKGHAKRHSHTWQRGSAKVLDVDGKLVDMETGEVVGRTDFGTEQIIAEVKAERDTWTREQIQANAEQVLKSMYGFDPIAAYAPCYACPPKEGYEWQDEDTYKLYGVDAEGNNVTYDFLTGQVERQAHARRVLEGEHGMKLPEDAFPIPADEDPKPSVKVNYHYHSKTTGWSYGTDQNGHSYERSPQGRLKRISSRNERIEVVEYAEQYTAAEASRKFDIPVKTVRTWVNRSK